MCGGFGLLYPVALHDLTITVDSYIPGAARLGLAVEHGRVCDVVVLKHALLELTLGSKVLLKRKKRGRGRGSFVLENIVDEKLMFKCPETTGEIQLSTHG